MISRVSLQKYQNAQYLKSQGKKKEKKHLWFDLMVLLSIPSKFSELNLSHYWLIIFSRWCMDRKWFGNPLPNVLLVGHKVWNFQLCESLPNIQKTSFVLAWDLWWWVWILWLWVWVAGMGCCGLLLATCKWLCCYCWVVWEKKKNLNKHIL